MADKTTNENMNSLPISPRSLVTVSQLAKMIPAYAGRTGSIRWQIHNQDSNGLRKSGALIRHGRRILIDTEKYFVWQEKLAQSENTPERHTSKEKIDVESDRFGLIVERKSGYLITNKDTGKSIFRQTLNDVNEYLKRLEK